MADSRGTASKSADKDSTSTRPARIRVMRPEVKEFLTSPRRSRPKKQPPSPPPSPPPPPPRKEKVKERKKKEKEKAATGEEKFERAQYNCAFQDEDEEGRDFAPPELAGLEVQNSGVRQGAYGAAVDSVYTRDAFHGKTFLDYISAMGKKPLAGADLLDLATAKAQLRAFNRSRGSRDLPEFVMFEGI
ncbi:unnamed protein product [Miscanthus lutarioriparius]|uniref:Uncharacterized protein n=1 Tax=Miscanthus lutarioriparius TaxID=422564 RepID=A0A811P278_9POAL|nr:unnamed protein product [Miscanthus lutarioriparius]